MAVRAWSRVLGARRRPSPIRVDDVAGAEADGVAGGQVDVEVDINALVESGQLTEAVDELAARNRQRPNEADEIRLIELRRMAAATNPSASSRSPWPPRYADPFPAVRGTMVEIDVEDLDAAALGGAVTHHGALAVRRLLTAEQVEVAREAIDQASEFRSRPPGSTGGRWYRPVPDLSKHDRILRGMVASQGGTWLADSPAATALVLDQLRDSGATAAITDYFGCRPRFSVQKSTLRRSPPVFNFAGWHQDGSFLGANARAMNVWMALTPCGGTRPTPGLEMIPARMDEVLPTDNGPNSAWVADDRVAGAAPEPSICPEFEPGDAILFDERFLHRTHLTRDMTDTRDAIECWFFAPGHDAEKYIPLQA